MSNLLDLPEGTELPVIDLSTAGVSEDMPPISEAERARQLPDPAAHFILCAVVDVSETFMNSSILKADTTRKSEELTSPVLFVIKLGPEAYKDTSKFPSGARCKEGDFVLTRPYAGTRIKIHGKEFRMIFDDQVEGTVLDPRGITRA